MAMVSEQSKAYMEQIVKEHNEREERLKRTPILIRIQRAIQGHAQWLNATRYHCM